MEMSKTEPTITVGRANWIVTRRGNNYVVGKLPKIILLALSICIELLQKTV